jgi:hypothetical protein
MPPGVTEPPPLFARSVELNQTRTDAVHSASERFVIDAAMPVSRLRVRFYRKLVQVTRWTMQCASHAAKRVGCEGRRVCEEVINEVLQGVRSRMQHKSCRALEQA